MKAIKDSLVTIAALVPAAARTATVNGPGVDLANTGGNVLAINSGAITDGVHTPKLQESSDNATWTDVATQDQVGALAPIGANAVQEVSYIGGKRYVRLVVTVTGAPATGGFYDAVATLSGARKQPA